MAKLRKGVAYRKLERPYTRVSKFRKKSYIRITPNIKVVKFEMGSRAGKFDETLELITKDKLQIRQEAIESARMTSLRVLEKTLGKTGFSFKIFIHPFHVLRENPLASGAGADRMSTGMKKAFGKPIGVAAQVKEGQRLMAVYVDKQHLPVAKTALKRASRKLPARCTIVSHSNKLKATA